MRFNTVLLNRAAVIVLSGVALTVLAGAQAPASEEPTLQLGAVADNVSGAPNPIRIDLLRWSTDAERNQLFTAWTAPVAPAAPRGGGGAGARGNAAEPAPPPPPEQSLADALAKVPALGYLWTTESAGYALRYAVRMPQPDGSERVILITNRRLEDSPFWKSPGAQTPSPYTFAVFELRLNQNGQGEGKASIGGRIGADIDARTLTLENYNALPVVLKSISRRTT